MANWTLQRVETNPPGGDFELVCDTGEQAWRATLLDRDTNTTAVTTLCVNPTLAPCDGAGGLLKLLTMAGYTPSDWEDECGF